MRSFNSIVFLVIGLALVWEVSAIIYMGPQAIITFKEELKKSSNHGVWRVDLISGEMTPLIDESSHFKVKQPKDVAINPRAGIIYYTDEEREVIVAMNLDGSYPEVIASLSSAPTPLFVEEQTGWLYYGLHNKSKDTQDVYRLTKEGPTKIVGWDEEYELKSIYVAETAAGKYVYLGQEKSSNKGDDLSIWSIRDDGLEFTKLLGGYVNVAGSAPDPASGDLFYLSSKVELAMVNGYDLGGRLEGFLGGIEGASNAVYDPVSGFVFWSHGNQIIYASEKGETEVLTLPAEGKIYDLAIWYDESKMY